MPPSSDPPAVETLIAGRSRRANAGNLLAKLLTQEADADDTLFLEDEDDVEFSLRLKDDLSDLDLGSSSSSDDDDYADANAPKNADAELEGERELLRAEKEAKRARKRKANDAFLKPKPKPPFRATERERKRVTIAEEQPAVTGGGGGGGGGGGRRKSVAATVGGVAVAAQEFVATRASSRTLSLQNRSDTMRRLEESEKRRLHTIALMEAAAAKKDRVAPRREMTQEERLAEARLTERRNLKSLNSWEKMEEQKLEEQRARLAALQNRKLDGSVVTYWSGRSEWRGDKLVRVGRGKLIEEVQEERKGRRRKEREQKEAEEKRRKEEEKEGDSGDGDVAMPDAPTLVERSTTPVLAPPFSPRLTAPPPPVEETATATATVTATPTPAPEDPPPAPPEPLELAARSLIILENFTLDQVRDRASTIRTLWGEQVKRHSTIKPHCLITHQPAKFCDPATGMPYANLHAYREIRRILRGEIQWSSMLGLYIGERGVPAKGVPEGF